jgi:hypothetical protein
MVGEIGGRFEVVPAEIDSDEFGRSSEYPTVLEIVVSDDETWPLKVGKVVNEVFFDDYPPIIFNVCFSCHRPDGDERSCYADPTSHWFNVFFGFYEIDVPIPDWERPFGFQTADRDDQQVEFGDLTRIGKADWNYFSNYMYGVPWWEVSQHNELDDPEVRTRVLPDPVIVGGEQFVECEVDGLEVVSGYSAGDEELRKNVLLLSKVWRQRFGVCDPKQGFAESFPGVRMKMRFLIRWERGYDHDLGSEAFKTFIYGGSINKSYPDAAFNERFLEAQMAAVEKAVFRKKAK